MRLRTLARAGARLVGYEAFPAYLAERRPLALRLRHLLHRCGVERVLDVGGNRGQYRDFLRFDVEWGGPILSFEPDPEMAGIMRDKAASDPLWEIRPEALGRERGARRFNRMRMTGYNSFLAPIGGGDPDNVAVARFDVEMVCLDDLLPELGALDRTFVKMDTQGYDLEVLAGGPAAFAQVPLVQTEVSFRPIYEGMPSWTDSVRRFEEAGFMFADLLCGSPMQGAVWEADCLLLKPAFA